MSMQEDDARIPVRYYALTDVHRERVAIVRVDRHWAKFQRVTRNGTRATANTRARRCLARC